VTSGNFQSYLVAAISVDRTERQRRELKGVEELALSIQQRGLIHPLTITPEGKLVAGERRLAAVTLLGWTHVSVQLSDEEAGEKQLYAIELEENVKRENLTWQDEVAALERYHKFQAAENAGWSHEDTAAAVGYSRQDVSRKLLVAANLGNETVAGAERLSAAVNMVQRNMDRKKSSTLDAVAAVADTLVGAEVGEEASEDIDDRSEPVAPVIPLLNTSFHDWQEAYDGPKFNLIHCDFPYGINVADSPRMDATIKDYYEDSPDIYWALVSRLGRAMDNVVAESAHLVFWHSMKYHADTIDALTRMGWKCNPFPLIWHKSDGSGIAPDPQRGPRQVYEAAIFASRGDRKITQEGCVANVFAHPGRRDGAIHASEKPYVMLRHFLRMICDEYSFVLDPTCGSGNALKVSEDLGAARVLGLEQITEFYDIARDNWSLRGGAGSGL
jgi:ParB/RepB/Spo0J family partition protein